MSKTYSAGIVTAYGAAKRAGYQGTYEDFCRQQAGYAGNAAAVEAAKTAAQTAANTATTKAGEAATAATEAQTAKTQTEAAASQALTDIGTARTAAISAVQTEGATQTANATAQAQAAAQSANTASTKASEASASATSAGQSATNAAASATSAATSASAAQAVLESIPEDYSDLSEDVDQLKADLADNANDLKSAITLNLDYNGISNAFDGELYSGYWNASGVRTSYANLDVCNANKIVCPENADVVIEVKTNVESPTYYISYLDDSTRIQRDAGVGKKYSGTSPVGTKYVCFTIEKSGLNVSDVQYVGVYINNKINKIDASIKENAANIGEITKTGNVEIASIATKHENEFYNVNNQFYAGGNQWDYYTFPVKQGDTFAIDTVAGGTVRGWAFRNANGDQLSIASYSGDTVQKLYENVVAPANATELIVNFKHVSGYLTISRINAKLVNENDIEHNGVLLPAYLNRISALAEEKFNILHGKVLCCCGDSITYGSDMTGDELITPEIESYQYSAYTKNWTRWTADEPAAYGYQIAARNGMIFYNGGESGACVQGSGGTSTVPGFSVADGEYTLLPDNIDYLTLFFGWNDTAFGSLGAINDTTNDSYYGGYNVVLPYLINKYPYTKIALIVPFGTDVGHRQAIRDLANKWGLACFDMYKGGTPLYWGKEPDIDVDSSIVTANRTKFSAQANSPHPNIHGHYQISTMLEQFLRGI